MEHRSRSLDIARDEHLLSHPRRPRTEPAEAHRALGRPWACERLLASLADAIRRRSVRHILVSGIAAPDGKPVVTVVTGLEDVPDAISDAELVYATPQLDRHT